MRVDAESWDDIRPKSAVAANVGAGPDIIMGTLDDPFKFKEKLLDLTDLAEYIGTKSGGWYPVARKYGMSGNRWIALPSRRDRRLYELSHQRHARCRLR